ncbi:hypothetical protein B0H34DRAFT_715690 [Crassisporium funariophilum]|nr:hypothetical protein B0H34DRAFT_715690 [Crassisporium funariophilum]
MRRRGTGVITHPSLYKPRTIVPPPPSTTSSQLLPRRLLRHARVPLCLQPSSVPRSRRHNQETTYQTCPSLHVTPRIGGRWCWLEVVGAQRRRGTLGRPFMFKARRCLGTTRIRRDWRQAARLALKLKLRRRVEFCIILSSRKLSLTITSIDRTLVAQ